MSKEWISFVNALFIPNVLKTVAEQCVWFLVRQCGNVYQVAVERARFLIEQAMEEDEAGNATEATELYMQAAEMCIQLVRSSIIFLATIKSLI